MLPRFSLTDIGKSLIDPDKAEAETEELVVDV
jgi:hypothetical protein